MNTSYPSMRFYTQVGFSLIVMSLCIFKLCTIDTRNDPNTALYWGGLTGVLGYWLPSPSTERNQEKEFDLSINNLNSNQRIEKMIEPNKSESQSN